MGFGRKDGSWTGVHQPGVGVQASFVKGAVAGVTHVCTGWAWSCGAIAAPVATLMVVQILDGATVIWSEIVAIPAAVCSFARGEGGFNLQGTPGNSMTIQFTALLANLSESVSMEGYDQQLAQGRQSSFDFGEPRAASAEVYESEVYEFVYPPARTKNGVPMASIPTLRRKKCPTTKMAPRLTSEISSSGSLTTRRER